MRSSNLMHIGRILAKIKCIPHGCCQKHVVVTCMFTRVNAYQIVVAITETSGRCVSTDHGRESGIISSETNRCVATM